MPLSANNKHSLFEAMPNMSPNYTIIFVNDKGFECWLYNTGENCDKNSFIEIYATISVHH